MINSQCDYDHLGCPGPLEPTISRPTPWAGTRYKLNGLGGGSMIATVGRGALSGDAGGSDDMTRQLIVNLIQN